MDLLTKSEVLSTFVAMKNKACQHDILMTAEHLTKGSVWALKMFDASTKIPEGVLLGNAFHLGNFDECLEVRVQEEGRSFQGKHCLASIVVNLASFQSIIEVNTTDVIPFTWSMCVPSSCSASDISNLMSDVLYQPVQVNPLGCHIQEPRPFSPMDWLAIGVITFFAVLCVLSTGYDLIITDESKRRSSLLVFSWYTNGKSLLSTKMTGGTMSCLHGLRFLTITWVVLGHTYFTIVDTPSINIIPFGRKLRNWSHVFITSALNSVDTFLLLGGMLVAYIFLKTMSQGRRFNPLVFYLHRYLRITPVLAVAILVHLGLILHFGSGPFWEIKFDWYLQSCQKNWWKALLHVQNYLYTHSMCIPVTWYLSVDMQMYWVSPLLLLPLLKTPRVGVILLLLATVASVVSCFMQMYMDDDVVPIITWKKRVPDYYFYTHTRATPWLVGMSLGYLLHKSDQWRKDIAAGSRRGLSKKLVALLWLSAACCMLVTIFTIHYMTQETYSPTNMEVTSYVTFSRLLWSLGVSWVIFACLSGYGGPVNTILSWKFFQPLSRLTFCIYILHMAYIGTTTHSSRVATYLSDANKVRELFSTMVYITLLAVPLSLMFEAPIISIEKILFRRHSNPRDIEHGQITGKDK